jgi:phage baseplate assembly protein W
LGFFEMNDIFLEWGGDLDVGSTGDLALVAGYDTTSQRVRRRLLTNAGDYIWQLDYGGGLAQFVGTPAKPADIEAVIRAQLSLESAVSSSPLPQVGVKIGDMANGLVVADITYVDASTGSSSQLNIVAA